ncbi:MAG: universal stress protein [Rhodospirillales bacterium]|nr:universal stress protein [Rhodospirillales bacterium]
MAYKEIVVHVAPDERSPQRLDAAVELAERHEGKVTGVYVLSRLVVPGFASFELSTEVYKRLDTEQRALAEEAERRFAERLGKSTAASEWRLMTGDPVDALTTSAHYADITVVGQTDTDDSHSVAGMADSVVLAAGGPVLVWPYTGSFSVDAATIMLAWNGTRESKRALSDALPLMQAADKVIVLGINTGDGKHIPGADVSKFLARHGVNAEARHTVSSSDLGASDALLSEISDHGANLLVMGGYGHHRMREVLLGGVTRDILRQMTVPVVMSH